MRFLSILAMVFLAVAIAVFPASAGIGPAVSAAHAGHSQHNHNDGHPGSDVASPVCAGDILCTPVAHTEVHDDGDSDGANPFGHGSSVCCDMTSCHAFVLTGSFTGTQARMNGISHERFAIVGLPSGLVSRLERPPRAA